MGEIDELFEAKPIEKEDNKNALQKYWDNLTPEEATALREKALAARKEKLEEKRSIQKAAEDLMKKKYRYKDVTGKIVEGTGYEARVNAMFKEVVRHGKNMVQADKQLQSYLGEDQPQATQNNNIVVIFSNEENINI